MKDRTGWTRGDTGPQRIGSKTYQRLVEFTRPCSACKQPFSIFVTERIAEGLAESNNIGLRNCELHRRGGVPANNAELSTLRHKDNTMRDEVAGLYAHNKELSAHAKKLDDEVKAVKAKLAEYESRPSQPPKTPTVKMPWE